MISISPWLHAMFFHCKASSLEAFCTMAHFCSKLLKCDNFGLYRFLRSGFFSFNFWFLYKFRHVLKFVCFLFFEKCGIKDQIVPLKKART